MFLCFREYSIDIENVTTGDMDKGSDDEGMEAAA